MKHEIYTRCANSVDAFRACAKDWGGATGFGSKFVSGPASTCTSRTEGFDDFTTSKGRKVTLSKTNNYSGTDKPATALNKVVNSARGGQVATASKLEATAGSSTGCSDATSVTKGGGLASETNSKKADCDTQG